MIERGRDKEGRKLGRVGERGRDNEGKKLGRVGERGGERGGDCSSIRLWLLFGEVEKRERGDFPGEGNGGIRGKVRRLRMYETDEDDRVTGVESRRGARVGSDRRWVEEEDDRTGRGRVAPGVGVDGRSGMSLAWSCLGELEACGRSLGDREDPGMDVEIENCIGRSRGDEEYPDSGGEEGRSKGDDDT